MIIISHKSCMDGLAAAWVCKQKYPDAVVYFCQYGDPLPEIPDDESVIMVDFSFSRPILDKLYSRLGGRLTVLDHHKTAQEDLKELPFAHFDMEQCGATMAWQCFYPNKEIPLHLQYIRDRDLWEWKLPNSQEFSAGMKLCPMDLDEFTIYFNLSVSTIISKGMVVLDYETNMIESLANKAKIEMVAEHLVPVVNSPVLQSEIGHRLLQLYPDSPFAAIYFHTGSEERIYSLRSRKDFDVSEVAKKMGGGGHPQAAGFRINLI